MVRRVVMAAQIADRRGAAKGFARPAAVACCTAMGRDIVTAVCAALPGAERSDPWGGGHDAWKVGGRMFACVGATLQGVAVKCPDVDTAELLIAAGTGQRAPYFHRSWVFLPWGTPADELAHRLGVAYRTIRAGLPKRVQAALPPAPATAGPDATVGPAGHASG
jgi:predicted DNA-binding protein (MmcQ/YjbR family)